MAYLTIEHGEIRVKYKGKVIARETSDSNDYTGVGERLMAPVIKMVKEGGLPEKELGKIGRGLTRIIEELSQAHERPNGDASRPISS